MKILLKYTVGCLLLFISFVSFSQVELKSFNKTDTIVKPDTAIKKTIPKNTLILSADSTRYSSKTNPVTEKHTARVATMRSLILPGWGQAYNKEYWKIPLVYGALSIPAITFFYNNTIYKEAKFANEARYKAALPNATHADSADYFTLDTKYQRADRTAIQNLRNEARRDRDYSIFWFLIIWGLNVADATVFAHLKDFDVSPNLAVNIKPDFNPYTRTPGLAFNFKIKKTSKPLFVSSR